MEGCAGGHRAGDRPQVCPQIERGGAGYKKRDITIILLMTDKIICVNLRRLRMKIFWTYQSR